jgi:hypothetical protein
VTTSDPVSEAISRAMMVLEEEMSTGDTLRGQFGAGMQTIYWDGHEFRHVRSMTTAFIIVDITGGEPKHFVHDRFLGYVMDGEIARQAAFLHWDGQPRGAQVFAAGPLWAPSTPPTGLGTPLGMVADYYAVCMRILAIKEGRSFNAFGVTCGPAARVAEHYGVRTDEKGEAFYTTHRFFSETLLPLIERIRSCSPGELRPPTKDREATLSFPRGSGPLSFSNGFALGVAVNVQDQVDVGRKVMVEIGSEGGARLSLCVEPDGSIAFIVTDYDRHEHAVSLSKASAHGRWVYLLCELEPKGERQWRSTMSVNNGPIASTEFAAHLPSEITTAKQTIGANLTGQQNAAFQLAELMFWSAPLPEEDKGAMWRYIVDRYGVLV